MESLLGRLGTRSDEDLNLAFRSACEAGNPDAMEWLARDPRVDVAADGSAALVIASTGGSLSLLELLLADPRVDPTIHESMPGELCAKLLAKATRKSLHGCSTTRGSLPC